MNNEKFEQWIGVYAIFDKKQEMFDSPFFATTEFNAKRRFIMMIDEKGSVLNRWHQDYTLYILGNFSQNTGFFDDGLKKEIMDGKSYVKEDKR